MKSLKVYRCNENAQLPQFSEPRSASFDIKTCLAVGTKVATFNPWNKEVDVPIKLNNGVPTIQIHPGYRVMIPTGLSFEVDPDHVVKVYARQELSVRHGLMFIGGVSLIDRNHTGEVFINMYNTSDGPATISNGDIVARAMLQELEYYEFEEISELPTQ